MLRSGGLLNRGVQDGEVWRRDDLSNWQFFADSGHTATIRVINVTIHIGRASVVKTGGQYVVLQDQRPVGVIVEDAQMDPDGRVMKVGKRWFFVTKFGEQTFRYEFEPSVEVSPVVGPARWSVTNGSNQLATVWQQDTRRGKDYVGWRSVGWWRNDAPAFIR